MEAEIFKHGLEEILDLGVQVEVITTDRSPTIIKIMREEYPETTYQFDLWHTSKGILRFCFQKHDTKYLYFYPSVIVLNNNNNNKMFSLCKVSPRS